MFLNLMKYSLLIISLLTANSCQASTAISNGHNHRPAMVSFSKDKIHTTGFKNIELPSVSNLDIQKAPFANAFSACSVNRPIIIKGNLSQPLADKASISFWFKPNEKYQSSKAARDSSQTFINLKKICKISFFAKDYPDNCVSMVLKWHDDIKGVDPLRILLPELPKKWINLTFVWDSQAGIFNAYVNGSAVKFPETAVPGWKSVPTSDISITISKLKVADFRFFDETISSEKIKSLVGSDHLGILDSLLGLADLGKIDPEKYKGPLIYHNELSSPTDVSSWVMEGPGEVAFEKGWMQMSSRYPEAPNPYGHAVLWCDKDFPADFVAQWQYQLQSQFGLTIIFFCAEGVKGQSIFDFPWVKQRTGVYSEYVKGDINTYGISYQAHAKFNPGRRTSNLRKASGFYLGTNGPIGIKPGDTNKHTITLIKKGPNIQMAVDDRKIIDFTDDPERLGQVLGKGKIGFRQMRWTVAKYKNFKVWKYKE
jgi:hypothetical protein